MAWLRSQGYAVEKVEQRVNFGRTTRDLFGFIDVVAIKEGLAGVLGVQATSDSHVTARVAKVQAEPRHAIWLAAGNRIWVVGWALKGAEGTRKVWTERVVEITPNGYTTKP